MAIKAKVFNKKKVPTVSSVMNIIKETVHETENCSHDDHGEVSVFLTRVESKLIHLFDNYVHNRTNSIKG